MSSNALQNLDVEVFSCSAAVGALGDPAGRAFSDATATFPADVDRLPEADENRGECLRGIRWGLFFEVLSALSLFGIWELWKMFR